MKEIKITKSAMEKCLDLTLYGFTQSFAFHRGNFFGTHTIVGCEVYSTVPANGMVNDINDLKFYDAVEKTFVTFKIGE